MTSHKLHEPSMDSLLAYSPLYAVRAVNPSLDHIAEQWDEIALQRDEQIRSGQDISMTRVLVPTVLAMARRLPIKSRVLDLGCGTGYLTEKLKRRFPAVVGIDPSVRSIEIAKSHDDSIEYIGCSAEAYDIVGGRDLIIANMVLMDSPDLDALVNDCKKILSPDGRMIFTATHPAFWPYYWGYAAEEWFEYPKEIAVESTFRISRAVSTNRTIHFHRPIESYFKAFCKAGFLFESFAELRPTPKVELEYPDRWKFPRFIAAQVRLVP